MCARKELENKIHAGWAIILQAIKSSRLLPKLLLAFHNRKRDMVIHKSIERSCKVREKD